MSETGKGRRTALTIDQLFTHHHGMHGEQYPVEDCIYRASLADLISVLEGLGAERVESHWAYDYEGEQTALFVDEPGSYIVWRIEEKK